MAISDFILLLQISGTASPTEDRVSSPSSHQIEKPYKPKFHNAALYTAEDQQKQKLSQQQQQQQQQQPLLILQQPQQPTTPAPTTSTGISISHPLVSFYSIHSRDEIY